MPPPDVIVTPVVQKDVPIYNEWVATLDGFDNAQIQPQVTGYIIAQTYREGSPVKKGQVLFEIDPRPFQAVLDQAKAQLAQAQAQLGKTKLDVDRDTPLAKERAIAQSQLDNDVQANLAAVAAVKSAEAQVESAQLNLDFCHVTSLAGWNRWNCDGADREFGESDGGADVGVARGADQSVLSDQRTDVHEVCEAHQRPRATIETISKGRRMRRRCN